MSSTASTILFTMIRGDDKTFNVAVVESGTNNAIDITGWSFKATIKKDINDLDDSNAIVQVDVPALSGGTAAAGTFILSLPNAQTANLTPGVYWFDVQGEANGVISTVVLGRIRVSADVTKRTG